MEPLTIGVHGSAWLFTYLVHSTLLLGGALLIARWSRLSDAAADRICKAAVLVGLVTTTLATTIDLRPLSGRVELPPAIRSMHIIRELRTVDPTVDGGTRVIREDRTIHPEFLQPAHFASGVFGLWLALALGRLGRDAARRRRFLHAIRHRRPLRDERLSAWLETLGVDSVRVTVSDALPGPAALSRREICLPGRFLRELPAAEQRSVLAHEIAHVLRRDPAWLGLLRAARAAFFFQPLHGVLLRRFRRSAEVLSDDWAVAVTGRPITLARSITRVAGWMRESALPVPALAEHGGFVDRVERLVDGRRTHRPSALPLALAGVLLLVPLVLFAAPAVGANGHVEPDFSMATLPADGAFTEDVHVVRRRIVSGPVAADSLAKLLDAARRGL